MFRHSGSSTDRDVVDEYKFITYEKYALLVLISKILTLYEISAFFLFFNATRISFATLLAVTE